MSIEVVGPNQGENSWRFACNGDQPEERPVPPSHSPSLTLQQMMNIFFDAVNLP